MRVFTMMLGTILITACSASAPQWPERTLRVAVEVPNPCWSIRITEVYRLDGELLAVSRLTPPAPDRMCAQVIATVGHRVTLPLPDEPVRHLVLGRQWNWGRAPPDYAFPAGQSALEQRLEGAELVHVVGENEGQQEISRGGAPE